MRKAGTPQLLQTATALVENADVKLGRGPTSTIVGDESRGASRLPSPSETRKELKEKFSGSNVSERSQTSAVTWVSVKGSLTST